VLVPRRQEMIAYRPTPAHAILELIKDANLCQDDVFCDLGSGLGHVVMLVALLSGARHRDRVRASVRLLRQAARAPSEGAER